MNHKIKLFFLFAILALFLVSTYSNSATAITNGVLDGDKHPYVCVIAFYDSEGKPLWGATGVLVAPNLVLTAGHATFGASKAKVSFETKVDEKSFFYESSEIYTYGSEEILAKNRVQALSNYDVGLVLLTTKVDVQEKAVLPSEGAVEGLKTKEYIDLVGYGVQIQQKGGGTGPYNTWHFDGYRYSAIAQVSGSNDAISNSFIKVSANPGQDKGGAAFGDSGGPILKAGTNVILGINSFVTNNNCGGVTYAQRLDIADIINWIKGKF